MPKGIIFWMLMIIWFLFGAWGSWRSTTNPQLDSRVFFGGSLLIFILLFLLGWAEFGFVAQ